MASYPRCCRCTTDVKTGCAGIWEGREAGAWLWVRDANVQYDEASKSWINLASFVWEQTEAIRVYCERCWRSWARHVKPGCKYGLSSACEELANSHSVKYLDHWKHRGNPFQCKCGGFFNHRSLGAHLRHRHGNVGSGSADATSAADVHSSAVYVPGCSDPDLSQRIQGTYATSAWNHGKPVYRKIEGPHEDPAVIFFWDDGVIPAWWFGPSLSERWAYCSSTTDMALPLTKWKKVGEDIDPELKILDLSIPARLVPGKEQDSFEVVWEFLASGDGRPEDWQPMGKEMQRILEEHWAGGWTGTFHIKTKELAYGIDCAGMVQWNLSTQRRRPIRRQHKATTAILPKLLGRQKRLQCDVETHSAESAKLALRVAELEKELERLKSFQAEHSSQMMLQEPWRKSRQLDMSIRLQLPVGDGLFSVLEAALRSACPSDHYGVCEPIRHLRVTGLEQIRNLRLWKNYEFRKDQIRKELEGTWLTPVKSGFSACNWADLDPAVNEIMVLHGTSPDNIDLIANFGFDERLARRKGLYGQGIYFTDQSCKAFQYSGADGACHGCMIITRLLLGLPDFARGSLQGIQVEPLIDPLDPSKGRVHSVVAAPGTPINLGSTQVHQEYIIFNGAQAYPEMIVHFQT